MQLLHTPNPAPQQRSTAHDFDQPCYCCLLVCLTVLRVGCVTEYKLGLDVATRMLKISRSCVLPAKTNVLGFQAGEMVLSLIYLV
jgi:hypothetical protein